jgi:hypothetical protein
MKHTPVIEKRKYRKAKVVSISKATSDLKSYRQWMARMERKHRREMWRAKKELAKKAKILVRAITKG